MFLWCGFTNANLEKIANFTTFSFHMINVKMINEDTCMLQMPQCSWRSLTNLYFRCLKHIFNSDLCSEISVSNNVNTYSYRRFNLLKEPVMGGQGYKSGQTRQFSSAANSDREQTMEAIESVANKLAIIGDELSQSYQELSCSGTTLAGVKPCVKLESWLNIMFFILKFSVWKSRKQKTR